MTPSDLILKLLKKQKYVSLQMIQFHISLSLGKNVSHRRIKKIIQTMRKKHDVYIGTSYKQGEGFYLVKTLKQHEKNLEFWNRRIKAASKMKALAVKNWSRMTSRIRKHKNKLVAV